MKNSFFGRIAQFIHAFLIEQIAVMMYWMLVVKYGAERISSISVVFWGVAVTVGILFVIKLASEVLGCVLEERTRAREEPSNRRLLSVLLLVGAGASFFGWKVFAAATDTVISGRMMVALCVATAISLVALDLAVKVVLGYLPGYSVSGLMNAWRERMRGDWEDDDGNV